MDPQKTTTFTGPDLPSRALVDTCVHCGFCLPSCPTYLLWGEEMDSPRGRIYLLKAGLENRTALTPTFVEHFDRCLGCLACVMACPSGVQYGPLIERARAQIERGFARPAGDRLFRALLLSVLPYPARLRLALLLFVLFRPLAGAMGRAGLLPARLRAAVAVAPSVGWRSLTGRIPARTPAAGPSRLTVGVLTGCVQRIAFDGVNRATVRVLVAEGCTVEVPAGQGCCGALLLHAGHLEEARALAKRTIAAFEAAGVDRIVVNAAGCGSAMKEYGELFEGDPAWEPRARACAAKVRDVSEVLNELGDPQARRYPIEARVAYHDACHLAHGQGVRAEPRALLQAIPGLEVLTPVESEICCGSAGIYNLVQPEAASALGARKVRHIAALNPDLVATGNPGCMLQIAAAARGFGYNWPIVHPIQIVDASIRGVDPRVSAGC